MSDFKEGRIPLTVYLTQEQIDHIYGRRETLSDFAIYSRFCAAFRRIDDSFPIPENDEGKMFCLFYREHEGGHGRHYRICEDNSGNRRMFHAYDLVGVYDSPRAAKAASLKHEEKKDAEWAAWHKRQRVDDDDVDSLTNGLSNFPFSE